FCGRNIAGNGWSTLARPRGAWACVARVQRIDRLRGVGPITVSRRRGRRLPFSPQRRTAMPLQLSLAVCDYDRTRAIFDGRAAIEGCDLAAVPLEPEESFHRAFKFQEFDVSEISMSSYMVTTARGDGHYIAIPAFVSRLFRHRSIYIRTGRGIARPQDLKGKTLGLPEYQMTANVWVRGILNDEYGVKPSDIKWRRGGLEEPGREERARITLPADVDYAAIPEHRTLSEML